MLKNNDTNLQKSSSFVSDCLISITISYLLYLLFYYFSPIIWSFNNTLPINEYMPWIRWAIPEHDGIELSALYILLFLNLGSALILRKILSRLPNWSLLPLLIFPFLLYKTIRFHIPMSTPASEPSEYILALLITLFTLFLSLLNDKNKWISIFIVLSLSLMCISTSSWISRQDYVFILSPAMRLLNGFGFNDSYFQYDYFISICAAIWMKFFSIWTFPILGRISLWLLLSGTYLFAKRYFHYKKIAVFLLVSLTIVRLYGNCYPPDFAFQISPLRLDLWLLVLVLAYWKGSNHWSVGLTLGLMIIFHRLFGWIYSFSYIIFMFFLCITEIHNNWNQSKQTLRTYINLYLTNIILIFISLFISLTLFQSHTNPSTCYLKNGYGFMPINAESFYWHFPAIFTVTFLLLFKNKLSLPKKFYETGLLLIVLGIGNLIYFFGRSHENNLINISSSLFLVLFLFIDLTYLELKKSTLKIPVQLIMPAILMAIVLITAFSYSKKIYETGCYQLNNIKKQQFFKKSDLDYNLNTIKPLTQSNSRIIFLSEIDFFYYMESGRQLPNNYNCFMRSWFLVKDYTNFLNEQLKNDYNIIVPDEEVSTNWEIISKLNASYFSMQSDFLIISNHKMNK